MNPCRNYRWEWRGEIPGGAMRTYVVGRKDILLSVDDGCAIQSESSV